MSSAFPFKIENETWHCGLCPKAIEVGKKSLIVYHKNTHFPKYACEECKKLFPQKSRLEVHMRTAHTGEKPYACSDCDKTFCQMSNLTDHWKKNHLGRHHGHAATIPREDPGTQLSGIVAS